MQSARRKNLPCGKGVLGNFTYKIKGKIAIEKLSDVALELLGILKKKP